jgi:hypothetical protein
MILDVQMSDRSGIRRKEGRVRPKITNEDFAGNI